MRLVWIVMPGCFFAGKGWQWQEWDQPIGKRASRFMATCKSYLPGFRLVTLEAAREDYGLTITSIPAQPGERET